MAQPVVSNSWDSSNVPELPRINPSLSPLVMNNPGGVGSSGPLNMQNSTSHSILSAQTVNSSPYTPHGLSNANSSLYLPGPNMFGTPTTNSGLSFSQIPEQFATFPPQYMHGNDTFSNMQNQFGGSVNLDSAEQSQYRNNAPQGSEFSQAGLQRPSAATGQSTSPFVPPNTYYQDVFPYPAQVLQQFIPYQNMAQVPHTTNIHSASLGTTSQDVPVIPSLNRHASFRSHPYGQFPQAGVSPTSTSIHHRRQHRTHSIASSAPSVQQQHNRANSQNVHLRTRSIREPSMSNGLAPHIHRSHTTMAGASHVLPNTGNETQLAPPLTQQEQVELARRLQMRELLRSARSNETHALQLYEETYFRRHRRHQEEAASHAKGLDDQKDGRPEPKDDEELTVNLECKICMSQLVDTVLIPCGHAILCRWCAEQHARSDRPRSKAAVLCPLCRTPVKQKLRIYLS
ncbi:C3HC4 finger protein [Aspergillus bombycis]|uniref:C3HC4 finger protein n=1 Tax=Aspergillus bombycis TaxID=109264 RepID=A0A1F7ZJN7_9EURO|nr:C3HC4 finger protein [Aspergillus bombycis]OGM39660.1 C3HC4 finger protein [Aspergillus bombycis]